MNYNLSIDLCKLYHSGVYDLNGKRYMVIPVGEGGINEKNGRVYLPVTMWERTNKQTGAPESDQYGSTHALRLNVSKEVRDTMTKEDQKGIPYLGNAYPVTPARPQARAAAKVQEAPVPDWLRVGADDDMPV